MQSVWTLRSTAVISEAPAASSRFVAPRAFRSYHAAPSDAGVYGVLDALWMAFIGGSVAGAAAGRRLASGRLAGQVRGAVVAVKAIVGKADAIQEAATELTKGT